MPIDKALLNSLPKVELHVHLDCSLSYDVAKKLDPTISESFYIENFIGPVHCHNLSDYLDRAEHALRLMQTPDNLALVVQDLYQQFQADGVVYAEVRFAPLLHLRDGMKAHEVVEVVSGTINECISKTGIAGGLILCTLRHFTLNQSNQSAQLACQFFGKGVIGFDIASDESGYPLDNHIAAFQVVRDHKIPCTAHAGEARGAESVWETLHKIRPQRIGHGVRSTEDEKLLDHMVEHDIHLEICPTSNIQTRACPSMHLHPIDMMYRKGISLSVNTDARTISDTTLTKEYKILEDHFNWDLNHFYQCNLEAIKHAFTTDKIKKDVLTRLNAAYKEIIQ